MNRRLVAIIAAAVLALTGGAMVFLYGRSADARAMANQETKTVYISTQLIPSGTVLKDAISQQLMTKTEIIAKGAPAGALTEVNAKNEQLLALGDIAPGQYLTAASFGATPVGERALPVPKNMVAMSVQLEDPARVGEFVTPGSRIAVFASMRNDDETSTVVLLPDTQVIAKGTTSLQKVKPANADEVEGAEKPSFLVTVAVTPEDATKLANAIASSTLYAALRSENVKIPEKLQVNTGDYFELKATDKKSGDA